MLTTTKVYACNAVKIYKNKPNKIFKRDGVRSVLFDVLFSMHDLWLEKGSL